MNGVLMFKKILIITCLTLLGAWPALAQDPTATPTQTLLPTITPTSEPESFPPNGFYAALADVNARIGQNINLVCSNPADAATCEMSDVQLDWEWSLAAYPDSSLACPEAGASYTIQQTSAYQYLFTWQNVVYDYRQAAFGGQPPFLCTATGREALLPPGSNPAITGNTGGTAPQPVVTPTAVAPSTAPSLDPNCPLPPRLQVNAEGRVTPGEANNVRAQPGLTQTFVGQIPGGDSFRILGGPVCTDGIYWWQIQYQLLLGWTGEGQNGSYWVEPIVNPAPIATALILGSNRTLIDRTTLPQVQRAAALTGGSPLVWSNTGQLAISSPINPAAPAQWSWVYDVANGAAQVQAIPLTGTLLGMAFNPIDDTQLATLTLSPNALGAEINLWTLGLNPTSIVVSTIPNAQQLAFSPDGSLLAVMVGDPHSASGVNEIHLYDVLTRALLGRLAHDDYPSAMAFSPDGALLASGNGAAIILWEVATRSRMVVLPAQLNSDSGYLAFSPDGTRLVVSSATAPDPTGNRQFYAALWDMTTRTSSQTLITQDPITGIAFNKEGTLLALAESTATGQTAQISFWDMATATPLGTVEPLEAGLLRDVSLSPDGTLLTFSNLPASGNARIEVFAVGQ